MPSMRKPPPDGKKNAGMATTVKRRLSRRFPQTGTGRSEKDLSPADEPMERPKAEPVEEPTGVQPTALAGESPICAMRCTDDDAEGNASEKQHHESPGMAGSEGISGPSAEMEVDSISAPQSHAAGGDMRCPAPATATFHDADDACPHVRFKVIHRRPVFKRYAWRPKIAFMDLTFKEFLHQLPIPIDHGTTGFVFDLVAGGKKLRQFIPRDDERTFIDARRILDAQIRHHFEVAKNMTAVYLYIQEWHVGDGRREAKNRHDTSLQMLSSLQQRPGATLLRHHQPTGQLRRQSRGRKRGVERTVPSRPQQLTHDFQPSPWHVVQQRGLLDWQGSQAAPDNQPRQHHALGAQWQPQPPPYSPPQAPMSLGQQRYSPHHGHDQRRYDANDCAHVVQAIRLYRESARLLERVLLRLEETANFAAGAGPPVDRRGMFGN